MILFVVYYLQDGIVGFVRNLFVRKGSSAGHAVVLAPGAHKDAISQAASTSAGTPTRPAETFGATNGS